jgi:hypothetical protein
MFASRSWFWRAWFWVCLPLVTGIGCAHHRQDYAYAPPYAPPVYPQPQMAQPVSYAAPMAAPAGAVMPAAVVPGTAAPSAGMVPGAVAGQSTPCPQNCPDGMVVGSPVVIEGGGQTPPCPRAP